MRVAIVSDIHANLQAWRAVRDDLLRRNVDTVVCLGDIVGYGPNPAEVLTDVRATCPNIILGNHDAAAAGILDLDIFSEGARRSAAWTTQHLAADDRAALAALPLTIEDGDILYTHADCAAPDQWGYVETIENARDSFVAVTARLVFLGHTHFPEVYCCAPDGSVTQTRPTSLKLDPANRYLINVGSVGDPRDQTDRASYAIYDTDTQRVEFHPVEFNVDAFARAVADVPELATPWFLKRRAHESAAGEREHAVRIIRAPASSMHSGGRATIRLTTNQLRTMSTASLKNIAPPKKPEKEPPKKPVKKPAVWPAVVGVIALLLAACAGIYFLNRTKPPVVAAVPASIKFQLEEHTVVPPSNAGKPPPQTPEPPNANNSELRPVELTAPAAKLTGKLCQQVTKGIANFGCWTTDDATAAWVFTVPQRTTYDVSLISSVDKSAGGTFSITTGKQTLNGTANSTGGWYTFTTSRVGRLTLEPGPHTLTIKAVKKKYALMNLERIRLSPQP